MTANPGSAARQLLRQQSRGALGTVMAEGAAPYVSLVMVAVDHDASPLLLLSDLAEHSRNIARDPRVSLLFDGTAGLAVPLTGERVTLQGRIAQVQDERLTRRHVARHPDAERYLGMRDFHLYRMTVERAHLVAGFGRIHWIEAADLLLDTSSANALAAAEPGIVEHMNQDHADAVSLYAERLLGRHAGPWVMTGIDPEGLDLRNGSETARLGFDTPVLDAKQARAMLVRLVGDARG